MKPESIKLFMAPDTCARVILTALEEIGCDYDMQVIAFGAGEHMSPDYLSINPNGAVPALVVDGVALTQNAAIQKYLDEVFPEANLLPNTQTALERWEINSIFAWLSADIHPQLGAMRFPQIIVEEPEAWDSLANKAADKLTRRLGWMETRLAQQQWVMGDTWSILDAYLSWAWFRAVGKHLPAEQFPAIDEMSKRHYARPASHRVREIEAEAIAGLEARGLFMKPKP